MCRFWLTFGAALALTALAVHEVTAQTGRFCAAIEKIARQQPAGNQTAALQSLLFDTELATVMSSGDADCNITSGSGAALVCRWDFPYRSAEASNRFAQLQSLARTCTHDNLPGQVDTGVNHPDFYEAVHFPVSGGDLVVSLKDKAALQATLVFLRFRAGE